MGLLKSIKEEGLPKVTYQVNDSCGKDLVLWLSNLGPDPSCHIVVEESNQVSTPTRITLQIHKEKQVLALHWFRAQQKPRIESTVPFHVQVSCDLESPYGTGLSSVMPICERTSVP